MIKVQQLSKRYHAVPALEDLSLEVPRGAIYGLIGPNGAGKTTFLRILTALTLPTSGQVWFDDVEVTRAPAAVQRKVGYMPDFFGVYPDLTAVEYLEFYAGIHGVPRSKQARVVTDMLELVDLSAKRTDLVETLSRGMKQRLCLARALIHDPEVLLLDEPAAGLDPGARVEFRELLRTLQGMGKTIVVSSHILLDLAELCSNLAIIREGHLVIEGDIEQVTRSLGGQQLEVRVLDRVEDATQLLKGMSAITNVTQQEDEKGLIHAQFSGDEATLRDVLTELVARDIPIVSFGQRRSIDRLEDVYMHLIEGASPV